MDALEYEVLNARSITRSWNVKNFYFYYFKVGSGSSIRNTERIWRPFINFGPYSIWSGTEGQIVDILSDSVLLISVEIMKLVL